jgi:hypothetical protein
MTLAAARVPKVQYQSPRTPTGQVAPAKPVLPERSKTYWWIAGLATFLAAVVPAVLWVGDISWLQDEPRLLAKAFHSNEHHTIESTGLNGNFGVPYGPLPTQIYQLLLLLTHDPLKIAAIRAALCAGVTAIGLSWLARTLRLNPWFATALVLAPYVWNFNRILWDASFAIPFGTLGVAAYAAFLRSNSGRSMLLAVACMSAMVFIHPQDLPVVVPVIGHLIWRRRHAVARHYIGVAVILGVTLALNFSYFHQFRNALVWQIEHGAFTKGYPGTDSRLLGLLSALRGGSILGGYRFAEYDSRLAYLPPITEAAKVVSNMAYPLIWGGIVAMIVFLARRKAENRHTPLLHVRHTIAAIALAGLALHIALYGGLRMPADPQYFFGTFILQALFAWAAIEALCRITLGGLAVAIYGISVAYLTIASTIYVHHVGYARNTYRPSLSNQIEIARALNRYADKTVMTDVVLYQSHPQAIRSLRLLIPPEPGQSQVTSGRLGIRHTSGAKGTDSSIEVVEAPRDAELDERFQPLDVTPLPPEWQPASW